MDVFKNINPITPIKINEIVSNSSNTIASKALCRTENTDIRFFSFAKDESISKEFQEQDSLIYVFEGEIKVQYNKDEEVTVSQGEIIALPTNLDYGIYAVKDSKTLNILVSNK